jgi:putative serine protease PepD
MSANEPNYLTPSCAEPGHDLDVDASGRVNAAPLWSPETAPDESADQSLQVAAAPAATAAAPAAQAGYWTAPSAPAAPAGYWASPTPSQYPVQSQYSMPPYQPWTAAPGFGAPVANPQGQVGIARHLGPIIVAVALLSASLSAVGTYAAVALTARPAASVTSTISQPVVAQQVTMTQSEAIVRVASQVKPSVVTIMTTDSASGSPHSVQSTGAGSGFIVTAAGLILTNNHVVTGSSSLVVVLDDTRQLPATVVATDPQHDLALIKINATGLTPVALGDSSAIQVGQLAIAIGSPLGTFTDSVTQGIVSGVNRSITVGDRVTGTQEDLSGLIQTDASINPGNSGGPLLDASGSVIGIVTASASNAQDVGFAIPINQAKSLIAGATK